MSHFTTKVEFFYDNFWTLVQPYEPFVAEVAAKASHVRGGLLSAIESAVGHICGNLAYDTDQNLWGLEDYWASASEVMTVRAGDCDDLALFGSSVLSAMGVPHYLVMGHLRSQIEGLEATPEHAPGHVWLEVVEDDDTYIVELTNASLYIIPTGVYTQVPYVPIERVFVS